MNSGSIKWDNEDGTKMNSKDGTLPDGTFGDDTIIEYCCQDQGLWSDSIELPLDKPFYLLPHKFQNCQRVKEAKSTLEYIIYDTENDNNYDEFIQSHVFTNKVKNLPKIYYCYYEGKICSCIWNIGIYMHMAREPEKHAWVLNFLQCKFCPATDILSVLNCFLFGI
jgi:hypothetical protein